MIFVWTHSEYRTDPLTVYEGGLGWLRISSMRMARTVHKVGRVRVWRTRWRPYTEITVMYVKDGVWHQPADVEKANDLEAE